MAACFKSSWIADITEKWLQPLVHWRPFLVQIFLFLIQWLVQWGQVLQHPTLISNGQHADRHTLLGWATVPLAMGIMEGSREGRTRMDEVWIHLANGEGTGEWRQSGSLCGNQDSANLHMQGWHVWSLRMTTILRRIGPKQKSLSQAILSIHVHAVHKILTNVQGLKKRFFVWTLSGSRK